MNTPIARASAEDLMSLAANRGTAPMQIGALLLLDTVDASHAQLVVDAIAQRIPAIPQLRQKLVPVGAGLGRPVWVDDPAFDVANHLSIQLGPVRGIEGLLTLAEEMIMSPLAMSRSPWRAVVVPGDAEHPSALLFVLHHVLADGIGGLGILASLANLETYDPSMVRAAFPAPPPSRRELAADALRSRLHAIRRIPAAVAQLGQALIQLRPSRLALLPRTSLNQPVGRARRFVVLDGELESMRLAGHAAGATVNDVLLTAIAGALHDLLAQRGEALDEVVLSVPFSARLEGAPGALGNRSGAIPLHLPAAGDAFGRLQRTAAITRAMKRTSRGASAALLGPLFRMLARLGLYQRFIDHQRLVQSFVTDIPGPRAPLSIGPLAVRSIIPLTVAVGNVTVSFAAMSYAGAMTITIVADPETCPDVLELRDALARRLSELTGAAWRAAESAYPG